MQQPEMHRKCSANDASSAKRQRAKSEAREGEVRENQARGSEVIVQENESECRSEAAMNQYPHTHYCPLPPHKMQLTIYFLPPLFYL